MAELKVNIGDKQSKKTAQKELKEGEVKPLIGKKIGDKVKGDSIGFEGYEFEVTGGSDHTGFPMRKDVQGASRKKILIVKGIGIRKNRDGRKVRRTVAGNTIHEGTAQVNLKVTKAGKKSLFEETKEEGEESSEEKKE